MLTPAQMSAPGSNRPRHRAQRADASLHRRAIWAALTFTLMAVIAVLGSHLPGGHTTTAKFAETSAETGPTWLDVESHLQTTQTYPAWLPGDGTTGVGPSTAAHRDTAAPSRSGDRTALAEQSRHQTGVNHDTQHATEHARGAHRYARQARHDAPQTAKSAKASQGNQPGYCLRWARTRAGIPAKHMSAAVAWRHAGHKHRGDRRPPVGAAVYWTGGSHGFGHIAISVGHGQVRSTDSGGEGRVATVGVNWPVRHWGLRYAGWADNINGYTIPGVGNHR